MKTKLKTLLNFLLLALLGGGIGLIVGFTLSSHLMNTTDLLVFIALLILFFILHIIIHEAGHGLFGTITGYKLISYRVFSYMWIRQQDNKFHFRRLKVSGTLGQCLMAPPSYQEKHFPFRLYLLGGVLANLISSILIGLFFLPGSVAAAAFIAAGLLIVVTNGIPMGFNDGMSIKTAASSPQQAYLLYLQLEVSYRLSLGETYQEMPQDFYKEVPQLPERTYFNDFQQTLILARTLDQQNWTEGRSILEDLYKRLDSLVLIYQLEIKKELLFNLCLTDPADDRISELWSDKQVQGSLKQQLMGNRRIEAAYFYYIRKENDQALHQLEIGLNLADKAPNPGDAVVEQKLLLWLKEQIQQSEEALQELATEQK